MIDDNKYFHLLPRVDFRWVKLSPADNYIVLFWIIFRF